MRGRKPTGLALLVAVAAMLAMAIGASGASATEVTPASTTVTLTQIDQEPGFVPANAYSPSSIQCKSATATFETPTTGLNPAAGLFNYNKNKPGVGAFSTDHGSVTMDIVPVEGEPVQFRECAEYEWDGEKWVEVEGVTATVTTNENNGTWTLSATEKDESEPAILAIGVPSDGATIDKGTCMTTVSSGRATSVHSDYFNEGSEAQVDAQIKFRDNPEGCAGAPAASPAQYEADFAANEGFEINP